ncbi:hypothetical protein C1I98_30315 [Spongiactinospora gelatinilytica]|uniref:Uncharacterized protein n=1 Tax=Spongiactinospora gelatinilytica TaxID=2666298 RepID=A0A2W2FRQ8_9ACTN|nr:hypothetical protein C1I98_30315 [Spongiactinospora gelatinilytica]
MAYPLPHRRLGQIEVLGHLVDRPVTSPAQLDDLGRGLRRERTARVTKPRRKPSRPAPSSAEVTSSPAFSVQHRFVTARLAPLPAPFCLTCRVLGAVALGHRLWCFRSIPGLIAPRAARRTVTGGPQGLSRGGRL